MKSLLLLSICMMVSESTAYRQQVERKREEIKSDGTKRVKKIKKADD